MKKNMGTVDRVLRIIAGVALLSLIFVGPKTLLGLIGLIPLITGLMSWCPIYDLIGMRTAKDEQQ